MFSSLSVWQLKRAFYKQQLQAQLANYSLEPPILLENSPKYEESLRYHLATVQGTFLNENQILLDNQTLKGRVGYRVFTPLKLANSDTILLIDRGFIPIKQHREEPIIIPTVVGHLTLRGFINQPPKPLALKCPNMTEIQWPIRVQNLQYDTISKLLHFPVLPFVLQLETNDPLLFTPIPLSFSTSPEKHLGYALQWFMMALTVLIYACVRYYQEKKCAN